MLLIVHSAMVRIILIATDFLSFASRSEYAAALEKVFVTHVEECTFQLFDGVAQFSAQIFFLRIMRVV